MLRSYLDSSSSTKSFKLFVNPVDLSDLSIAKIRLYLCMFIRIADPGSVPLSHDLRKIASSFAFFHSMSFQEIQGVTGWKSCRVFVKHYLKQINEVSSSFVALGSKVPKL